MQTRFYNSVGKTNLQAVCPKRSGPFSNWPQSGVRVNDV